jgi:hypothetical protein
VVPVPVPQPWVKASCCWQEEPADSWEETLEVKDSWEMEEETVKVIKSIKPRFSAVLWIIIDFNHLIADPDPGSHTNADPCGSGSWADLEFSVTKSLIST